MVIKNCVFLVQEINIFGQQTYQTMFLHKTIIRPFQANISPGGTEELLPQFLRVFYIGPTIWRHYCEIQHIPDFLAVQDSSIGDLVTQ